MAFTTANIRIINIRPGFLTECFHPDLFAQTQKTPRDSSCKDHIRAGICPLYGGNRAFFTEIFRPVIGRSRITNEAAFFPILSPVIITVEIATFKSGWRFHNIYNLTTSPQYLKRLVDMLKKN